MHRTAPKELPETEGARSRTVTLHPARSNACAADSPPMDPPITNALMRFAMTIILLRRNETATLGVLSLTGVTSFRLKLHAVH